MVYTWNSSYAVVWIFEPKFAIKTLHYPTDAQIYNSLIQLELL